MSFFFFSSRRRHTRFDCDWSSDVCSSDLQKHADARVNGGKPQVRGIAGIRKLVRKANIRFSGMKRVSDGVEAFALVNRGLRHIHAKGAGGRDILERSLVGDREFEIALAAEIRPGWIGIVLDVVLFGADQLAVARLK